MNTQLVTHVEMGGAGARLHVVETGKREGMAILFVHGFSQSWLTWQGLMESQMANDFRLVAMDLRGHGRSDKPADGYDDAMMWAEDIAGVMRALELDRPVLCAWSYGGWVVCDYLRIHGQDAIGGINLVGAATSINPELVPQLLGKEFLGLLPGFVSNDVGESLATLEKFVRLCRRSEPSWPELYTAIGYNSMVPPAIRQALMSRTIDSEEIIRSLRIPVLISQGEHDQIVAPAVAHHHAEAIPTARLSMYPDSGHAPFVDEPERFVRELTALAEEVRVSNARESLSVRT